MNFSVPARDALGTTAELLDRSTPPNSDPTARLDTILHAARTHLGMDVGFISEFTNGRRVFRHVDIASGNGSVEVGGSDLLEESYCHWVAHGKLPKIIRDPAEHPLAASLPVTKALRIGSYLSTTIRLRDGSTYGSFCCFSAAADPFLTRRDLATLEAFAELAGQQIQDDLDSTQEQQQILERIRSMLAAEDVEILYQPAIRLEPAGVEFREALARFRSDPNEPPDRWFASAAEVGLGPDLEMLAMRHALAGMRSLPPASSISINISPATVLRSEFSSLVRTAPLERLILEITEHDAVDSYTDFLAALEPLRMEGLRLAIDDAGAGYSSFRHILLLHPDLIKLDMSLVSDINLDRARRALASALINFAREIGCEVVAEGVETDGELQTLADLGVPIVQGHLMGKPQAADQVAWQ